MGEDSQLILKSSIVPINLKRSIMTKNKDPKEKMLNFGIMHEWSIYNITTSQFFPNNMGDMP